jgi:polar amino acid transport system substrate-binding protein
MSVVPASITRDLSPTGTLRAAINLGNPVLAQGTPAAPAGVTVDMETGRNRGRLGSDVHSLS